MTEEIKLFEENLIQLLNLHKKLRELEQNKKDALVSNDIKEIELITAVEEKTLLDVSLLEEERYKHAGYFGEKLGKKAEEITMSDMVAINPSLKDLYDELENEIAEIGKLNEINTKLLENAVNILKITVNSLTAGTKTTYSKTTGKENDKTNAVHFINKNV